MTFSIISYQEKRGGLDAASKTLSMFCNV